jgi:hypothetical protein
MAAASFVAQEVAMPLEEDFAASRHFGEDSSRTSHVSICPPTSRRSAVASTWRSRRGVREHNIRFLKRALKARTIGALSEGF